MISSSRTSSSMPLSPPTLPARRYGGSSTTSLTPTASTPYSSSSSLFPTRPTLRTLHLPPSFTSTDQIHSGLWNWIHSCDFVDQEVANDIPNPIETNAKIILSDPKVFTSPVNSIAPAAEKIMKGLNSSDSLRRVKSQG